MITNKLYNLKIKTGAQAARFLIDLKQALPVEEVRPAIKESRLEKLAEVDYRKVIKDFWIPCPSGRRAAFVRLGFATARRAGMTKLKRDCFK